MSWSRQGQAARQVQGAAAAGAGEAAGDVEQAVAEPFRFREREFALEHEQPQPGEQVLGEQRELEPGLVGLERLEGQPAEPELLRFLDAVLDAGVQAVAALELGDVCVGLVGEEALVAVPVGVGEAQLRAGVRPLLAHDQPCPFRPAR